MKYFLDLLPRALLYAFLVSSSLVLFSPISTSVSASSAYDNMYNTTETLQMRGTHTSSQCNAEDITNSWGNMLLGSFDTGNTTLTESAFNTMKASFANALENGRWGVSQWGYNGLNNDDLVYVYWTEDTSLSLGWDLLTQSIYAFSETDSPVTTVRITCVKNANSSKNPVYGVTEYLPVSRDNPTDFNGWYTVSGSSNVGVRSLFFYTDYPNYPSDYEGSTIVDSPDGSSPTSSRPEFTYEVRNKDVKATDYNQDLPVITPDDGYTISGYSIEWTLFRCKTFTEVTNLCEEPTVADHQIMAQTNQYSFTVSEYGDYKLSATYLVQQCYRYPSYPATPDYCFYVDLDTELEDHDFTSTTVYLKINGQTINGDTTGDYCDVSGFCAPPEVICYQIENFMDRMNCELLKTLNVGLLNPSIQSIKFMFTSFTVPDNPQCNITISDVRIGENSVFPLSSYSSVACSKSEQLRDAFPFLAIISNFILSLIVLIVIIRIINDLTDNKKTDMVDL